MPESPIWPVVVSNDDDRSRKDLDFKNKPVSWISPFLMSLLDTRETTEAKDTGFREALARITSFCFQEMQHMRFGAEVRAAAAQAGFDVRDNTGEKMWLMGDGRLSFSYKSGLKAFMYSTSQSLSALLSTCTQISSRTLLFVNVLNRSQAGQAHACLLNRSCWPSS